MYTVVIADDEPLICDGIEKSVQSVSCVDLIKKFYDGQTAYDYLSVHSVDICLLDIKMPGKSGLDIAEMLHAKHPETQIIVLSAYRDFEYARQAIRYGVYEFLSKPFPSSKLVELVSECVSELKKRADSQISRWQMTRDMIVFFAQNGAAEKDVSSILLCNETVSLEELNCTEILLSFPELTGIEDTEQEHLFSLLRSSVEADCMQQSSCCYQKSENEYSLLVFSKGSPDLSFLEDVLSQISAEFCTPVEQTSRSFVSFSAFLVQTFFNQKMEDYFQELSSKGVKEASGIMDSFLQVLTDEQAEAFSVFLAERYHLMTSLPDKDGIRSALNELAQQAFDISGGQHLALAAKEYIEQNYDNVALSLSAIAGRMSVSTEYLSRVFKKNTGQRFSDYLVNYRMEKAKKLLVDTNMPTIQIADAVGYSNSAYFRYCFKSHFGMTPTQYRLFASNEKGNVL